MKRSPSPLRVIIVEDSKEVVDLLRRHLESCGFELSYRHVQDAPNLSAALAEHAWDVVLSDHVMPNFTSLGTLEVVKKHRPDTPVIVISGRVGDSIAAGLMNAGARDFVPKTNLARLHPAINRELEDGSLRQRAHEIESDKNEAISELSYTLDSLRKTQDQLVRTERYSALAQMGSGVAHDFNNALTKMIGIIELMIARSPDPSQPLQQLKTTVLEATKIVQRLRAFYKPGAICLEADPADLNAIIVAAVELTKPKWKTQCEVDGHPIEVRLDLDPIPLVRAKPEEFREAIVNLILNACDAMPDGGVIAITTEVNEDAVVIAVVDNGNGMTDRVRQRCLEPYFTTKGRTHLGIGLGLVNRLVRGLGGALNIQSREDEGTAVVLRMIACEERTEGPVEENPAQWEEISSPAPERPLRILVADDDIAVRVLLSQFLRLDGHHVDLAKDGKEALEKFDPERHDLVISDRAMPVLNGEQLARDIKARSSSVPFIMASGYFDSFSDSDERPCGVDLLLAKPITRESLRTAVHSATRATASVCENPC